MKPEKIKQILELIKQGKIKKPGETLGLAKMDICPDCGTPLIGKYTVGEDKRLVGVFECSGCSYAWVRVLEK
jgi:hypothetical protein